MTSDLEQQWLAAWPDALTAWGPTTRMAEPVLHATTPADAPGSFAWYDGREVRVHIDLAQVRQLGVTGLPVPVLAHEIGHHVMAPGDDRTRAAVAHRIREGLVDQPDLIGLVANLWHDLLINDRLQRTGTPLAELWIALKPATGADPLMDLVLRADELLWNLPRGTLAQAEPTRPDREGHAHLLARLVRAYRRDIVGGAGGFAAMVRTYFGADIAEAVQGQRAAVPGLGCRDTTPLSTLPAGLAGDPALAAPVLHPLADPKVVGDLAATSPPDGSRASSASTATNPHGTTGDSHSGPTPYALHQTLSALGSALTVEQVAAAWYRELAAPHLVPFPTRATPVTPEPLLGGLAAWEAGDDPGDVDWTSTVLASPVVVPGVTTRKREYHDDPPDASHRRPVDLDLFLDSSGSMPDPSRSKAPVVLAGTILALSALRVGARVRVTIWSGPTEVATSGFTADAGLALTTLMTYFGGGTQFPLHLLRRSYLDAPEPGDARRGTTHLAVVSDSGIDTMFPTEGEADLPFQALRTAGGGGSLILDVPRDQRDRLPDTREFDVYFVSADDDLVTFARAFARRWWGGGA